MTYGVAYPAPIRSAKFNAQDFADKSKAVSTVPILSCIVLYANDAYTTTLTATQINPNGSSGSLSNAHSQYWENLYFAKPTTTTNQCYIPLATKTYGATDACSITLDGTVDVTDGNGTSTCTFYINFLSDWNGRFYSSLGNHTGFDFQIFKNAATSTYTLFVVLNHDQHASTAYAQARFKITFDPMDLRTGQSGWSVVPAPINLGVMYVTNSTELTPSGTMYSAHQKVG